MFTKSSMKAIFLGSCGIFVLSSSLPVTSTNAGDFPLLNRSVAILPANTDNDWQPPQADMSSLGRAVLPELHQDTQNAAAPSKAAPLLPGDGFAQGSATTLPGENPFVKRAAVPVATPQVSAEAVQQKLAEAFAIATAAQPAVSGTKATSENPFETPAVKQKTPSVGGSVEGKAAPKIDETALRYYASTQDLKRLGAELRRLKAIYPEWETPEDLFDPVSTVQEQPLWDIYATGNYVAVRAELSRLQTANPQWKPSKDLLTKLRLAEIRKVIDRSYSQKNWRQVIQMGQETPDLLVCANTNVLWQVGEALAQTRDFARSFDLYKYILTTCTVPEERLATVQKASLVMPEAGLQSLVALGSVMPDGSSEFEAIGFEPLRRKMGQVASGEPMAAPIGPTELEIFSSYVQRAGSGNDAGLFGWYYYSQQDYEAAHAWFTAAMRLSSDTKNVEGVVLSLRNMNKTDEAMAFAKRYGKNSPEVTKEYIEIVAAALTSEDTDKVVSDEELAIFEKAVFATKSATGAQALGWKKLKEKDTPAAKELFETSLAWEPTQGGVIGSAVIATRAKDRSTLAFLKASYGKKYTALNDLTIYGSKKRVVRKADLKNGRVQKKTVKTKGFFETLFAKRES